SSRRLGRRLRTNRRLAETAAPLLLPISGFRYVLLGGMLPCAATGRQAAPRAGRRAARAHRRGVVPRGPWDLARRAGRQGWGLPATRVRGTTIPMARQAAAAAARPAALRQRPRRAILAAEGCQRRQPGQDSGSTRQARAAPQVVRTAQQGHRGL